MQHPIGSLLGPEIFSKVKRTSLSCQSENYILKSLYNIELILQKKELARVVLLMS
jgi:hypothetical protein